MRTARVLRYWCDHCKKGGCQKAAIAKHEKHCVRNPDRSCRMCLHVREPGEGTPPNASYKPDTAALIVALEMADNGGRDGVAELRKAADGCPACMLAAILQYREKHGIERFNEDGECFQFDYKKECEDVWKMVADARRSLV